MNKRTASKRKQLQPSQIKPVYAAVLLAFAIESAQANPVDATVVSGQASFATTGNTLTIVNTPGTIINWGSFSIGQSEITHFVQQSASSAVLNRVVGSDPSNILGTLQSNGRVFLINPHGIVFGAGSTVSVAGLVASTLNLSDADFQAGRYNFTEVPGAQNISNAGNINAQDNGQIYLIAPNVENSGVITAPNGEIYLAAGSSVELVNSNDPNLRVSITAPAGDATNVGQLIASSGSLGLFGAVVKNSGTVSADSATMQGGRIVFRASERVEAGGTISASGAGGGEIKVLADMQGGTVSVTGTLDASAPVSGDGGYIDTSAAHVQIANSASITTAAASGNSGNWLIDPTDFYISAIDPANGSSWMSNTVLSNSLLSGNVTIQTLATGTGNGDIFVNDAVNWNATTTLTLNAHRDVNINAAITSGIPGVSDPGNLTARADLNGTGVGTINFGASGSVVLQGGAAQAVFGSANFYYNPVSYSAPTDFSAKVTANLTAAMLVNNVTQLQSINTSAFTLTQNYALGRDIDATATATWNAGAGFLPLGDATTPFTGSLSGYAGSYTGSSYVINGLTINTPLANSVGLFGYVGSTGKVYLVNLTNAAITGNSNVGGIAGMNAGIIFGSSVGNSSIVGAASAGGHVGGLVGYNSGGITSSFVSGGSVSGWDNIGGLVGFHTTGGSINASHATGVTVSGHSAIGGLVGSNGASITNSYVETGTVTATLVAGGLVGGNVNPSGSINSSYVSGTSVKLTTTVPSGMVGGLVGSNGGAISTSYVTGGLVDGGGSLCWGSRQCVGGLVGFNGGSITNTYATTTVANGLNPYWGLVGFDVAAGINVTNSFWDMQTTTAGISSGVGNATNSMLLNKNVHGLTTAQTMTSGSVSANGFDMVNTWYLIEGDTRPFLQSEWSANITNSHQLQLVAMNPGASYTLGANIDLTETTTGTGMWSSAGFVPLPLNGQFDGLGHTIGNLYVNRPLLGYVGLFGSLGIGSAVSNVGLVNANVTGGSFVGALAGYNGGSIVNSHADNVSVSANNFVGGLVGYNTGWSVSGISYGGSISGSYVNGGMVSAVSWIGGGLVGWNGGSVDNSHASGVAVIAASTAGGLAGSNGGHISNSYVNSGQVSGDLNIGGLIGDNSGILSDSYVSIGSVIGISAVGGLTGGNSGVINNAFYNINGVTINGGSQVTLNGLYNDQLNPLTGVGQYTDWFDNGLLTPLNIADYSTTLSNIGLNSYSLNSAAGLKDLLGFAGDANNTFSLAGNVSLLAAPGLYIPYLAADFNGNNFTISNLNVNQTFSDNVGLFGRIALSSTVSNLRLQDATVAGHWNVGALAGWSEGNIVNVGSTNGNVIGFTAVGGLVGDNQGSFAYTASSALVTRGNITGSYVSGGSVRGASDVGGLVGYSAGGAISGSAAGSQYGAISNSYVINGTTIAATGAGAGGGMQLMIAEFLPRGSGGAAGGLVGRATGGSITGSYVDGARVTGISEVGGLVGAGGNGTLGKLVIDGSHASNSTMSGGSYIGGLVGSLGNLSTISGSHVINSDVSTTGTGFVSVGGLVGWNDGSISNSYVQGGTVQAVSGDSVGGLAGWNTGFIDTSYATGGVVVGLNGVGGLVGGNYGVISNSFVSNGNVTGASDVGGLVGMNLGGTGGAGSGGVAGAAGQAATISNSYVSGGSVIGSTNVGGLVGLNQGGGGGAGVFASTTVFQAGAGGAGGAATISNSYASGGVVTGSTNVGSLVGSNASGATGVPGGGTWGGAGGAGGVAGVVNTFWNTDTAGALAAVGLDTGTLTNVVGLTTAQMMSMSSFTGWSIANSGGAGMAWRIYEGNTMPLLTSFLTQLTVTANDVTKIYDGNAYSGGVGVTYSVAGAGTSVFGTAIITSSGVNVGSYALNTSGLYSSQQGYDISYASGTLTVNPYAVSMTASRVYDGTTSVAAGLFTFGPLVGTETLTLSGVGNAASQNAGTQSVAPGTLALGNGTGLASNYTFTGGTQSVTITPAALAISADAFAKIYGDADPLLTYLITSGSLIGNDTLTGSLLRVTGENVGTYAINQGTLGNANYTISYTGSTLTINPAALTITANDATKIYGDTQTYLGTEFTSAGLVNGETIGSVTLTSAGDAANANVASGPYAITASAATGGTFNASNYSITYVDGQLSVTPALLTIVADDLNKILTTADPLLTYTVYGLKLNDTAAATVFGGLIRDPGETVGNYQINMDPSNPFGVLSSNYAFNNPSYYTPGNFTILAPTVINEIVNISVQDSNSSEEDQQNTSEALLLVDAGTSGGDQAAQALPVCQ